MTTPAPPASTLPAPATSPGLPGVRRAALLVLSLLVVLTGLVSAPAEAAPPHQRVARLQQAVRTAQQAWAADRDALVTGTGEAAPVRDRATQAGRAAEVAEAAAGAAAAAAGDAVVALGAAQVAQDAARASAEAAAQRARSAADGLAGAQQGAASAAAAQQQAVGGFVAADQAVRAAQGDLDQERGRWSSCTQASGRFMCRRDKSDAYQPVPRLDQLLARREAAQQAKDARYHELASANQARAEWDARVQQSAAAAADAQAVAVAAAGARDQAQAAQAAALAKRDETAAASVRAAGSAAAARATRDAAVVAARRAEAAVDLLRAAEARSAATLTRARQHLRYVKRQLARR